MKKHLKRLHVATFQTVGHNLIHNLFSRYNVHKYTILSLTWPLKPSLVKNHNLIRMLSSTINKFKNLTKYSNCDHQNYPKPNIICVFHKKNIHWNFQRNFIILSKVITLTCNKILRLPNRMKDKEANRRKDNRQHTTMMVNTPSDWNQAITTYSYYFIYWNKPNRGKLASANLCVSSTCIISFRDCCPFRDSIMKQVKIN